MGHSFNRFQKPPLRWQLCVTCASESMTGEPIITQYRGHWFQDVSSQTKSLSVYLSRKPWKVQVLHPIHHGFTADVVWNHHLTAYPCCRKRWNSPFGYHLLFHSERSTHTLYPHAIHARVNIRFFGLRNQCAPLRYWNPAASLLGPFFADESDQQLNPFEETHEGTSKDGHTNEDAGVGIDTGGVNLAQQNHQWHHQGGRRAKKVGADVQKGREHVHTLTASSLPEPRDGYGWLLEELRIRIYIFFLGSQFLESPQQK